MDVFTQVASGQLDFADVAGDVGFPRMVDTFAARARFFDDFFAEAGSAGLRQVVIVASGLDARPYRLSWPAGTTLYEIDQPEVIEFKTTTLAELGATPAAEHRPVGIDLRDDWAAALQGAGFDAARPTAWLAEGVLIGFLPPEAEVRLLDNVTELSAPGSKFSADYGSLLGQTEVAQQQAQTLADRWREHGLDLDVATLTYPGDHTDVAAHLQAHGWDTATYVLVDLFEKAGIAPPEAEADLGPASIDFVRATRK
jgi:methyltransferase (TIGR00027 family)